MMNFSQTVELNGHLIYQSTPEAARVVAERLQRALDLEGEIPEMDRWLKEGDQQEKQR
jgi:hypothetical protein